VFVNAWDLLCFLKLNQGLVSANTVDKGGSALEQTSINLKPQSSP
jgi:hypothetical protein